MENINSGDNNTFTEYLGVQFQQKFMWQFLLEPEFANKILPNLSVEYFDEPMMKRLFIIIKEFVDEFGTIPNLVNKSIYQAITMFKTPNNLIEEESLNAILKKIEMFNEMAINQPHLYDGDTVKKSSYLFIKQQEYRKMGETIVSKVKRGGMRKLEEISKLEENFQKITRIGDTEDDGEEVIENVENALKKEFRETIPTGIHVIDTVTGGGLGKGEIGIILSPSGVGKAQNLSAKISTPNGWKRMGEIKVGDIITGSDGGIQTVLGVYPQGKRPIYKIGFNDGTSCCCDEEHLWAVNDLNLRTNNTTIKGKCVKRPDFSYSKIKTTKELMDNYKVYGKRVKLNYRIPIVKPVEYINNNILPLNPYLLGALIGDGTLKGKSIHITNVDEEILTEIKNIISCDFPELSLKQRPSNSITYTISGINYSYRNKLNRLLKELNLKVNAEFKHIPDIYKYSSIQDRINLLQGLLDTDGYASKEGRVQFYTISDKLAEDVRELVLSLGGFCKIKTKIGKYKKDGVVIECKKINTLTLSFTDSNIKLFRLKRKQDRVKYRVKYKYNKYISSIEYSHEEEAQCIYVSNDDHLYVTDDFILTHNTTTLTKIANTAYEEGKNVAQIVFEDTIPQVKRKHYTIWSGIPLSQLDDEYEIATQLVNEKISKIKGNGRLVIKRMSQETTTMIDIRAWLESYQKKFGIKFDILVLDYLDCVNSHKKTANLNDGEIVVIKSFEALAGDFNIPAWTAIQTNRSGFESEVIGAHHSGGSIKRIQKSHFFMSIQKTQEQKEANLANISIVKARFAKDGQFYKDAIFNNDTLEIRIEETFKNNNIMNKGLKKVTDIDVDKLNSKVASMFEEKQKENVLDDLKSQFMKEEKIVINEDKLISNTLPINDGFIQKDNNLINDGLIIKDNNTPTDLITNSLPINDGLINTSSVLEVIDEPEVINSIIDVKEPEVDTTPVSKATDVLYLVEDTPLPPQEIDNIEQMLSNPDITHSDIMEYLKNKRSS